MPTYLIILFTAIASLGFLCYVIFFVGRNEEVLHFKKGDRVISSGKYSSVNEDFRFYVGKVIGEEHDLIVVEFENGEERLYFPEALQLDKKK